MALSNTGASSVQPESGAGVPTRPASPIRSSVAGFSTYSSAVQDVRTGANPQQQCSSLPRPSLDLELPQFQQTSVSEGGKEATTHDFLSLYGATSSAETAAARGLASCITTQDFLQPLEKGGKPASSGLLSHGLVTAPGPINRLHNSSTDNYNAGQLTSYALVNGTLELPSNVLFRMDRGEGVTEGMKERLENLAYWSSVQLKFRSSDMGYAPKTMPSHTQQTIPIATITKQWQQQQQAGSEFFDMTRRPPRLPSEDDEDEDDESVDRGQNQRKDNLLQKGDTSHKLDGKSNDCKGSTPRSKHSATEQRRRSKINDRFQMLRQLVPNNDQKRDKASFLLEVIEYIQFLQEKVRKYDAAEHGRQQERLKTIPWDVCQRNTGVRDSTADAPHIDSLAYGKEHIPLVSTVPFEMKQTTDANGLLRPRLNPLAAPGEHEASGTEVLSSTGHVSVHLDRQQAPQVRHSSYENKSVTSKSIPVTLSTQPPTHSAFVRSSAHVFHSAPQATPEAHVVYNRLPFHEEQALPPFPDSKGPPCNKIEGASFNKIEGAPFNKIVGAPFSQLLGNNLPPAQNSNNVDEQKDHENVTQPEHCQQVSNHGQQSSEEPTATLNHFPDLQHTGTGSSVECPIKDSSQAHDVTVSKAEQKVEVEADGQEPLAIHGGVINVSSVYSQGLLDTLTRALQSSGLDLSQASISVQIDLGKPGEGAVATNSMVKSVTPSIENPQQLQGQSRQAGSSLESERPHKKPKIEVDV